MMRMDDPPGDDDKQVSRLTFTVCCVVLAVCTFVVVFYLAAIALLS